MEVTLYKSMWQEASHSQEGLSAPSIIRDTSRSLSVLEPGAPFHLCLSPKHCYVVCVNTQPICQIPLGLLSKSAWVQVCLLWSANLVSKAQVEPFQTIAQVTKPSKARRENNAWIVTRSVSRKHNFSMRFSKRRVELNLSVRQRIHSGHQLGPKYAKPGYSHNPKQRQEQPIWAFYIFLHFKKSPKSLTVCIWNY